MGKPCRPKQPCVYLPKLEELEEERDFLLQANENDLLVVESLCESLRTQRREINTLKAEIKRLSNEIGIRDKQLEKYLCKGEK